MAFPTIPTVAGGRVLTTNQENTTATRTFPNLSGLTKNAGDLLIAIVYAYQASGTNASFGSWGGGFTEFGDFGTSGSTVAIGCAYKWSTGSETGTFTVTQAGTPTGFASMILLSIPGAHASTPPEAGGFGSGTSTAANAGSFNPTGWDAEDTLWIAVNANGETSATGSWTANNSAPTNYTDYVGSNPTDSSTVGQVAGAVAFRQLNAAAEDPGAFSQDTSNARSGAAVIAVRPAAAIVPTQTSVARISLASGSTPVTQTAHSIKVRARVTSGAGTIRAALYEGASNRSGDLESAALTTSLADYTLSIADASAANITDYSDLEIRLWGYAAGGGSIVFEVDQLWLEIPAAGVSGTTYTKVGAIAASTVAAGADSFQPAETGSVRAGALQAGADATTFARAGSVTPRALAAGVDSFQSAETGSLRASALTAGADAPTLNRAGALVAGTAAAGADASSFSEAGTVAAQARASGADAATFAESGTVMSQASASGTAQAGFYAKLGALIAQVVSAGADVFTAAETGALLSQTVASGADVAQYAETGTVAATARVAGADAATFAEAGSLLSTARASGDDAATYTEAGAVWAGARAAAADTATFNRTGTVMSQAITSGASQSVSSSAYTKTGAIVAGAQMRGADAATFTETGTVASGALISGGRSLTLARTGSVSPRVVVSGADATTYTETGVLTTAARVSGPDSTERVESGAVVAGALASGPKLRTAARSGAVVAGALASGGRQATFNRTGSVLTSPISAGSAEWISSSRPLSGPFNTPAPHSAVTSDPGEMTGVFTSDPHLVA